MGSNDLDLAATVRRVLLVAVTAALGACSSMVPRDSPVTTATRGSPTVLDIYRGATGESSSAEPTARELMQREPRNVRPALSSQIASGKGPGDTPTQGSPYWSALEPMQQRFARVPNPDLVMVVFPHMAKGTYPVPGYVTVFPMYEQTVYALPGEVEGY